VKFMGIQVKCPKCGHVWEYKGTAIKATCTSCYSKVQVRSLPDPDPGPRKAPAVVKKILKKSQNDEIGPALSQAISRQQAADGQVLRGQVLERSTGKVITETIEAPCPVPVRHTLQPLDPAEAKGECQLCHKPLSKKPRANVLLDGQKVHALCVLDKAIREAAGDLGAAAQAYEGITLGVLQKRVLKLRELGKLNQEGVLA